MAEVFVGLGIVWLIVTIVGHVSWIICAAIIRVLFGPNEPTDSPNRPVNDQEEIRIAHRVIARLESRKLISQKQADAFRAQVNQLQYDSWGLRESQESPDVAASPALGPKQSRDENLQGIATANEARRKSPTNVRDLVTGDSGTGEAAATSAAPFDRGTTSPSAAAASVSSTQTQKPPKASLAEAIQEFLVDHNIRWGELVAGMLIVVCSIGLVISLWSTLTQTHRIVPSLIFLTGNAAIFGAGLYTLFRWKLHESSRATLVIAILLVPLGILAGLSIGGVGDDSVPLDDPVTLLTILGVGASYLFLLWRAGSALLGRRDGIALAIGVGGPAALLPLMPAATRVWGETAGAILIGGSIALGVSFAWLVRGKAKFARSSMPGKYANRVLLVSCTSGFSLAVLTGYAGYLLQDFQRGWLTIAVATLPGLVSIAAACDFMQLAKRREKLAFMGQVVMVVALGIGTAILIPSMTSLFWLGAWAITFSASAAAASFLSDRPKWTAIALAPISIAAVVSAPTWVSHQPWNEIELLQSLFGGDALVASLAVASLIGAVSKWLLSDAHQRPGYLSAAFWLTLGIVIAAGIAVTPPQWNPGFAAILAPIVLFVAMVGSLAIPVSVRTALIKRKLLHQIIAATTILLNAVFWISWFRPFDFGDGFDWQANTLTLITSAGSLVFFAEFPGMGRVRREWFRAYAAGVLILSCGVSLPLLQSQFALLSAAYVGTIVLCWWIGISERSHEVLVVSRIATFTWFLLIGIQHFPNAFLTTHSWVSGYAFWVCSAICCGTLGVCWMFRELVKYSHRNRTTHARLYSVRRFDWYVPSEKRWDEYSLVTLLATSVVLTAAGCWYGFVSLALNFGGVWQTNADRSYLLPIACISFCGLNIAWHSLTSRRHANRDGWNRQALEADGATTRGTGGLAASSTTAGPHVEAAGVRYNEIGQGFLTGAAIVWATWLLISMWIDDSRIQLIASASIAAILCGMGDLLARFNHSLRRLHRYGASIRHLYATGAAVIGIASWTCLTTDWLPAIGANASPNTLTTYAMVSWLLIAGIAAGVAAYRLRSQIVATLSAVMIPACVLIVMPLFAPGDEWLWLMIAAIASGVLSLTFQMGVPKIRRDVFISANHLCRSICFAVGASASCWATLQVLTESASQHSLHALVGMAVTSLAIGVLLTSNRVLWGNNVAAPYWRWPMAITLLGAHVVILAAEQGWVGVGLNWNLLYLFSIAAIVSVIESWANRPSPTSIDWASVTHSLALSVVVPIIALLAGTATEHFVVALIASGVLGFIPVWLMVQAIAAKRVASKTTQVIASGSSYMSLFFGCSAIFGIAEAQSLDIHVLWTLCIVWIGGSAMLWRTLCPLRGDSAKQPSYFADSFAAILVMAALVYESVMVNVAPVQIVEANTWSDPKFLLRLAIGIAVVASATFRATRRGALEVATWTAIAVAALLTARLTVDFSDKTEIVLSAVCLAVGATFTSFCFFSRTTCRGMNGLNQRWRGLLSSMPDAPTRSIDQQCTMLLRASALPVVTALTLSTWLLIQFNSASIVPLAICSVALLAAGYSELAELTRREPLRDATILLSVLTVAMLASLRVDQVTFPFIELTSRWFVAWVCVASLLGFALPQVLSRETIERWYGAARRAMLVCFSLASLSLVGTLMQEASVRVNGRTDDLSQPIILIVAGVLAGLSAMTTFAAISSGPGFAIRDVWKLSDNRRRHLTIAAQAFGGLTWFHLFLCKHPLSDLGLRAYWPYVVMFLAFASVGITEWARRRKDTVLEDTLKQTALYLPLIPVIGFWLSGSLVTSIFGQSDAGPWSFIGGQISYQALLVTAAVYYAVVSVLWKGGVTRLASVVLGNFAFWVVLIQTPNWDFLTHPQVWIIPPAVCVLALTHLHRRQLGENATSQLRYATTLVIYISSTADMLIQGVGSTLAGPIVLVCLALIGMFVGIALRVRPFLYLGTTFVLVGVTSMVWHAQQQIDAVWPWWAFGISTGVLLLVGLMALEKNRPQIRKLAYSLSRWDA